jgi:hypothetical protein
MSIKVVYTHLHATVMQILLEWHVSVSLLLNQLCSLYNCLLVDRAQAALLCFSSNQLALILYHVVADQQLKLQPTT